jgi:hypothetical protein
MSETFWISTMSVFGIMLGSIVSLLWSIDGRLLSILIRLERFEDDIRKAGRLK